MLETTAGLGLSGLRGRPGQFPVLVRILEFAEDRESIWEDDYIGVGLG